jgi:predicted Zn-dependent protease with MMP-like domain
MALTEPQRRRFDDLLEDVLAELPEDYLRRFDEIPLVVEDYPSPEMARKLKLARGVVLQGVHSGIPLTRRSIRHSGTLPTVITIYREGIYTAAGGNDAHDRRLRRQIRKTVLHELGHHFGFGEEQLRRYGYG